MSCLHYVSSIFFKNCICTFFLTHFCLALLDVSNHFLPFCCLFPDTQAPQEADQVACRHAWVQGPLLFCSLHCPVGPSSHLCFCYCQVPGHLFLIPLLTQAQSLVAQFPPFLRSFSVCLKMLRGTMMPHQGRALTSSLDGGI